MGSQGGVWGPSDTPLHPRLPPESGDVKATVAVLSFILSSAAKHSVDGESLSSELQQLGLPKGTGTRAGRRVTWAERCWAEGRLCDPGTHLVFSGPGA